MNIVLALHQFFPYYTAGTEQLCLSVAKILRAKGHQVNIATAVPPSSIKTRMFPTITYQYAGFHVTPFFLNQKTIRKQSIVEAEYNNLAMQKIFDRYLKQVRPDVVHFFHLARFSASVAKTVIKAGIPSILTTTDFWFECPAFQLFFQDGTTCQGPDSDRINCFCHLTSLKIPGINPYYFSCIPRYLIKAGLITLAKLCRCSRRHVCYYKDLMGRSDFILRVLSGMTRILPPTEFIQSRLISFGVPKKIIELQPYGIFMPSKKNKYSNKEASKNLQLGYVGAIQPHKGLHILIEALKIKKDLPISLKVYGKAISKKYELKIRKLASGDPRIIFCGIFPNNQFSNVFRGIDALIVPSIWHENAPLVVLSAIAHRCPVIVSNVPGLKECVREGFDGFFFSTGSKESLSEVIEKIIVDRSLLDKVHTQKTSIKSIEVYTGELEATYQELTKN